MAITTRAFGRSSFGRQLRGITNNMTKEKKILIVKASGQKEPFSEEKLWKSLEKSGVQRALIKEVVDHIRGELKDGMKTTDIYRHAFSFLRKRHSLSAARYNLKRAIMELGPSGHPFEKLVGEILKTQGFSVEVGKTQKGFCVFHEIDVVAQKDNRRVMVECKFHNQPGIKSDIKVALYVQARFEDIERQWEKSLEQNQKFNEVWLVTNTKLTSDAIKYANCVKMKVIGWDYPLGESFQDLIEKSGLHPLTCLTTLSRFQKRQLLERGFILCRDVGKDKNILRSIGISESKVLQIIKEINQLC